MKIITGENQMLNTALLQRLRLHYEDVHTVLHISALNVLKPHTPIEVYFTGGTPFGSQAVRERPADVCSQLAHTCLEAIDACHHFGVNKMVYLASSCIYPPSIEPLREDSVTGVVAPLNEPAAWPRLLALKLCQFYRKQYGHNFVTAVPATAYGPGDDFSDDGHALPVLMRKMHDLKKVNDKKALICHGSGRVQREWIYVDDLADGLMYVMEKYDGADPINIGSGFDMRMKDLITILQIIVGVDLEVAWDSSISPGVERQFLSSEKIHSLGWTPQTTLREGLERTYEWFKTSGAVGQPQRQD